MSSNTQINQTQNNNIERLIGKKNNLKPTSKLNTISGSPVIPLNLLSELSKKETPIKITNIDPILVQHAEFKQSKSFKPKLNIQNTTDDTSKQSHINDYAENNSESDNDTTETITSNSSKTSKQTNHSSFLQTNQTNLFNDDMTINNNSLDEFTNSFLPQTYKHNVTKKIKTTDIKINPLQPKHIFEYKPVLTENNVYIDILPDGGRGNTNNLYVCLCNVDHQYGRKSLKIHFDSLYHQAYLRGLNESQKTRNLMYVSTEDVKELRKENAELKLNLKTANMITTKLSNNLDVIALKHKNETSQQNKILSEKNEIIISLTKKLHQLEKEINSFKQNQQDICMTYEELSSNNSTISSEIGDIN
jgi:hypothetical protein